jgi:putative lipoic acid-binding regulatory protein
MSDKRESQSLYPCLFPVKIIGESCAEFEADVLSVMARYVEDLTGQKIGRKVSGGGKYLSLTIHIVAKDREQLETLYAELNAREKVIMVL